MKLLLGLLVSVAISSAFALPAHSPKDDVDLVEVPREPQQSAGANDDTDVDPDFRDFKGIVDTGAGYPFLAPLPHPFSFNLGFFDSFEDIFRRLRTRLWSVGDAESSEEGGFSLGLDPTKGANTTSVVKVIDGHKIEINDTVLGNGDGSNGAVFKFRVINIRPLESSEEELEILGTQPPPTEVPTRDIEGKSEEEKTEINEQKSDENEINANIDDPETTTTEAITTEMHDTVPHRIPSSDNNAVDNDTPVDHDELQVATTDDDLVNAATTESLDDYVATLDEDDSYQAVNTKKSEKLSAAENDNEDEEDNVILEEQEKFAEVLARQQMQDLVETVGEKLSMADEEEERFADEVESMLSANIHAEDPASEPEDSSERPKHLLREDLPSSDDEEDDEDVKDISNEGVDSEWGSLDDKNILTNEIDVYQSVPIDLSNDIAINDIMADQGAPVDPDAEVFSVDEFSPSTGEFMAGRRFEVLRDIK